VFTARYGLEIKLPGHGFDHPLTSSAQVQERVELFFLFGAGPSWEVTGLCRLEKRKAENEGVKWEEKETDGQSLSEGLTLSFTV
jgi:hypothetical protein